MTKLLAFAISLALVACVEPEDTIERQGAPGEQGEQGAPGVRGAPGADSDALPMAKEDLYFVVVTDDSFDLNVDIIAACQHPTHIALHGGCSSTAAAPSVSMPNFPTYGEGAPPESLSGWRCAWFERDASAASAVTAFATCYQPQ